ncbi:hypothetical protein Tco_0623177 [Tanacetum coccineum]
MLQPPQVRRFRPRNQDVVGAGGFANKYTASFELLDLSVHNFYGFFNEVEFVVELDFLQGTVNNLPMGYPVLPQPSLATTGQPHMNAMGMSNCHVVNGVLASSNFHPMHMNSGNG